MRDAQGYNLHADAREPSARIKVGTRTQWAYATLKTDIINNVLAPGSSYLEQDLAERLGVSRTPLREAAQKLEIEGLVEIRPRHGIRILPLDAEDLQEVYDILRLVEPQAAALIAARGVSAEDLLPLRQSIDEMEAAIEREDPLEWAQADNCFHTSLMDLADHRRIKGIAHTLWDQVHRARVVLLPRRGDLMSTNEDYRDLLRLIEAGDADGAADALRRYHETTGWRLVNTLQAHCA